MTEHTFLELAAPFALDALDPEDRRDFEAHLAECEVCEREVMAYREVVGLLAYAAEGATPPSGLKSRVVRQTEGSRAVERRAQIRVAWLAAAASLTLAAGLGWYAWGGRSARMELELELATAESVIAARDSLVSALLAPDVLTARLTATDAQPMIRLYWNRTRGLVVLAAFRLEPAPPGRIYQLWGIPDGGTPVSVGIFNTAERGEGTTTFLMDPDASFALSAVTEEPAGGSPQPTTTPFLVGAWLGSGP